MKRGNLLIAGVAIPGSVIPLMAFLKLDMQLTAWIGILLLLLTWLIVESRLWILMSRLEQEDEILTDRQAGKETTKEGLIPSLEKVMEDLKGKGAAISSETVSRILAARIPQGNGAIPSWAFVFLGLLGTLGSLAELLGASRESIIGRGTWVSFHSMSTLLYSNLLSLLAPLLVALGLAVLFLLSEGILRLRVNSLVARAEEYVRFELLPRYASYEHEPLERALQAVQQAADGFSESTRNAVLSVREDLSTKFSDSLTNSLTEFSSQWKDGLQKLEKSLSASREDLAKDLNSAVEKSGQLVNDVQKNALQNLSESIASQMEKMRESQDTLFRSSIEESSKRLSEVAEATGSVSQNTDDVLSKVAAQTEASLKSLSEKMESSLGSLSEKTETALDSLGEKTQSVLKSVEDSGSSRLEDISSRLSSLGDFSGAVSSLQDEINSSLQFLGDKLASVAESGVSEQKERFDEMARQALQSLSESLGTVSSNVLEELRLSHEAVARTAQEALTKLENFSDNSSTKVEEQTEKVDLMMLSLEEAGQMMKVNQAELQSSLEMFSNGVENLVENLSQRGGEQESRDAFYERLEATLEAFHEKASDVLVENSLRTQEILLEVLEQSRPSHSESQASSEENHSESAS